MTLNEIEQALQAGQIYAEMRNGKFWRVRRNGKTKIWRTRPGHFEIPVKAGLRSYGYIRHDNLHHFKIES